MVVVPEKVSIPGVVILVVPPNVMAAFAKTKFAVAESSPFKVRMPPRVVEELAPVLVMRLWPFRSTPAKRLTL